MSKFKDTNSLDNRKSESARIIQKYPDRIPIICERSDTERSLPELDRKKYLTPSSLTFAEFQFVIRKRIDLKSDQALYCFVGETALVPVGRTLSDIYNEFKNEDGFLYVVYASESTFGMP
jgi:GABA(A) receptor-associated protein